MRLSDEQVDLYNKEKLKELYQNTKLFTSNKVYDLMKLFYLEEEMLVIKKQLFAL